MHFLGNFGIDSFLLAAQVVNFLLLLWLLTKFVYKPVMARIVLDEKELASAERQLATLDKQRTDFAAQQKEQILATKQRAQEIITEAESMATHITARANEDAQRERAAVIAQIHNRLKKIDDEYPTH